MTSVQRPRRIAWRVGPLVLGLCVEWRAGDDWGYRVLAVLYRSADDRLHVPLRFRVGPKVYARSVD